MGRNCVGSWLLPSILLSFHCNHCVSMFKSLVFLKP